MNTVENLPDEGKGIHIRVGQWGFVVLIGKHAEGSDE